MDLAGWTVLGLLAAALLLLAVALLAAAVRRHGVVQAPGLGVRAAPWPARDQRPVEAVPPEDERLCHADEVDPDCGTRRHDRH
jgi:hypothetical protein